MNFSNGAFDCLTDENQDFLFPDQGGNVYKNIDEKIDEFIANVDDAKTVSTCSEAIRVLKTGNTPELQ
eukprot:7826451-Ditylum_brightwellii.AAC.1